LDDGMGRFVQVSGSTAIEGTALLTDPHARLVLARQLTRTLREAVARVGIEEFASQDQQFDEDSQAGRDLLYLAANDEWCRATREIVTLAAADTLATSLQVHVDLAQITHEAFRHREERIWLPLAVLPPPVPGAPVPGGRRAKPTIAPSPQVRDRAGNVLPSLPQSQARRWIAAAMAEIILNVTPGALDERGRDDAHHLAREQRLLLSAAIYRVLREGSDHEPDHVTAAGPRVEVGYRRGRVQSSRERLIRLLSDINDRLERPASGHDRATLMVRRAARILHALSSPTTLAVVGVAPNLASAVFTVNLAGRSLHRERRGMVRGLATRVLRGPRMGVDLDVLLPAVDADRAVVVNLPEGVSFAPLGAASPIGARIVVDRPRCLRQVDELTDQLAGGRLADPVARAVADFTVARMDVARDAFRHYRTRHDTAVGGASVTEVVPDWMDPLRTALRDTPNDPDPSRDAAALAAKAVAAHPPTREPALYRVHESGAVSPSRAHVRVPAVENRNVRGTPVAATVHLELIADGSAPLHTARYAGFLSLILLGSVLVGSIALRGAGDDDHPIPDPQVLASVLTLFAAIQAGRVVHPDRATLRGLLTSSSSWVILASILPTVLLGVALAFRHDAALLFWSACIVQLVLQAVMYSGPLTGRTWPRERAARLRVGTATPLDYPRTDVLHSSWWRSTTAGALLLGSNAHAFVLPQQQGGMGDLLSAQKPTPVDATLAQRSRRNVVRLLGSLAEENGGTAGTSRWRDGLTRANEALSAITPDLAPTPANILAMLRTGTRERSLTFMVFREEPRAEWQARTRAQVDLDVDRLIAHEAPVGTVDVYIGRPSNRFELLTEHPLQRLLGSAARRQLLVLDVQFPAPPPPGGGPHRLWTRTRLGLRGDEVFVLGDLLTDVLQTVRAADAEADLLIDLSSQTPPRRFLGTGLGPAPRRPGEALNPADLDVVHRVRSTGGPPDDGARDWLSVAMCDYAHDGAEAEMLAALSRRHPQLELAGLTTALLHGTCVLFVLGHQPGVAAGGVGATVDAALPGDEQLLVEEWTTAAELGGLPAGGVMFEVHAEYSDRPGLFSVLLQELVRGLDAEQGLWVSYLRTEVPDGRNAASTFLACLPQPARVENFGRDVLDRVEQSARRVLARAGHEDQVDLGPTRASRATVNIELVTAR
jgi:uncharacterized membrane protein